MSASTLPGADVPAHHLRRSNLTALAASFLVVLPSIVVAVTWLGADWSPTQDFAVLDLRMRALLTTDTPLTGAFSRYGWNHVGPAWYWMLAPLHILTGGQPWSLVVGGALYVVAVLGLGSWIAHRLAGPVGVVVFAAVAAWTYANLGAWPLVSPWNPHLAIPTFLTFLVGALALADGRHRMVAALAIVGSALVQLHIAYAFFVLPVLVWSGLSFARTGGLARLRSSRRLVVGTLGALAVLWAPALIETVLRPPGNVAKLARYTIRGSEWAGEPVGLRYATGLAGYPFRLPPTWLGHTETADLRGWVQPESPYWLGVGVLLCIGAWVIAGRQVPLVAKLVQLSSLSLVMVVVAVSRIAGERWSYLVDWRWPVAAMVWVTFLVAVGSRLRRRGVTGALLLAGLLFVGSVSVARAVDVVRDDSSVSPHEDATEALVEQVRDNVATTGAASATPVVVAVDAAVFGLRDGLLDAARRDGIDARAPAGLWAKYGQRAVLDVERADTFWLVTETSYGTSLVLSLPGANELGLLTPLSPADDRALRALHVEAAVALHRADRLDLLPSIGTSFVGLALADTDVAESVDLHALGELNARLERLGGCRCATVATDGPDAPQDTHEVVTALRALEESGS